MAGMAPSVGQQNNLYSSTDGELYRSYDQYAGQVGFYQVDEVCIPSSQSP